jgi:hypothetical protein
MKVGNQINGDNEIVEIIHIEIDEEQKFQGHISEDRIDIYQIEWKH